MAVKPPGKGDLDPVSLSKGQKVLVYWDRFDAWFPATVSEVDHTVGSVTLDYDDGFVETIKYTAGVSGLVITQPCFATILC